MSLAQNTIASIRPRATRFFWSTVCAIVIADLVVGLGFIFGLPANTPTFRNIDAIVPLVIMGALLVMAAMWYFTGLFTSKRTVMVVGLSLASFVNASFAFAFFEALLTGVLLGFPSIAIWGAFALIHVFAVVNMPPSSAIREANGGGLI